MEQQSGIIDAIFGGLKRAGEVGIDLGKTVAQIPMSVVTAIPDFAKDPEVFLAGGREDALAALLSPDFRKRRKADLDAAREFRKLEQGKQAVEWVQGLFQGVPMNQRANVAQVAEQGGATSEMVEQGLSYANQQDQARQQAVGVLAPEVGGTDMAEGLLSQDPTTAGAYKLTLAQRAAQRRQERADARAAKVDARSAAAFAARDLRTPEQKRAEREAERNAARQAQIAKERATAEASDAARDVTEKYKPILKDAPDVPQSAIDAAAQDWNPFNNYPEGTQSRENILAKRAAERRAARTAAYKAIEEALPNTSRKNIGMKRKLRAAVPAAVESAQDTGLDNPLLTDAALPTDPAERIATARSLGEQLLAAGFPPDKAAAELLRRGYKVEELPE